MPDDNLLSIPTNRACPVCRDVHASTLFVNQRWVIRQPEAYLGCLGDLLQSAIDCPFCKLVAHPSVYRYSNPRTEDFQPSSESRVTLRALQDFEEPNVLLHPSANTFASLRPVVAYISEPNEKEPKNSRLERLRTRPPADRGTSIHILSLPSYHRSLVVPPLVDLKEWLKPSVYWCLESCRRGEHHDDLLQDTTLGQDVRQLLPFKTAKRISTIFFDSVPACKNFRLIDIKTKAVVDAKDLKSYVVLSYTWGKVSESTPMLRRHLVSHPLSSGRLHVRLPKSLPATIADAMSVAQRLGFRYIWIDMLCIIQDDPDDKADQIAAMGHIYAAAEVCIVACGAHGIHAGLPGVSVPRSTLQRPVRLTQAEPTVADVTLGYSLPDLNGVLKQSAWGNRGWTMQEHALSRRRLFFTNHEVFFQCSSLLLRESTFDHYYNIEDANWRDEVFSYRKPATNDDTRVQRGGNLVGDHPALRNYIAIVQGFSLRRLSYTEDKLNALVGLFKALFFKHCITPRAGSRCGMFSELHGLSYGVLLGPYFRWSLLWVPSDRTLVRKGGNNQGTDTFPSWSWAGWDGMVDYDLLIYGFTKLWLAGHECLELIDCNAPPEPDACVTFPEYMADPCAIDHPEIGVFLKPFPQGVLPLQVYKASLHIRRFAMKMGSIPPLPTGSEFSFRESAFISHNVPRVLISDSDGNARGVCFVSSEFQARGTAEFIRLGDYVGHGELTRFWHSLSSEQDIHDLLLDKGSKRSKQYSNETKEAVIVMMISWKDGIAYREGVGQVLSSHWRAANPLKTKVFLA